MIAARSDEELWEAFNSATLPEKEWTHRAHLRVAWMFVRRHPELDDAHILMRVGIIRLNGFHGLVETTARGYHETLTRFWLALVKSLASGETSDEFVDQHESQLGRDAVLRHYTKELVMSVRARAAFVEPDVKPLP